MVIDGVDEALGWSLRSDLFPTHLPRGVHVVLSAREIAGRDWSAELEISLATTIRLTPLTADSIADFVRQADAPPWLGEAEALAVITEKSQGDPFYLRLLCERVAAGQIKSISELAQAETGLDDALKAWWADLKTPATEAAVEALLKYLTVVVAPITRGELIDIDEADALRGVTFDDALSKIERYVTGDPSSSVGLSLSHWRLKDFLAASGVQRDTNGKRRSTS